MPPLSRFGGLGSLWRDKDPQAPAQNRDSQNEEAKVSDSTSVKWSEKPKHQLKTELAKTRKQKTPRTNDKWKKIQIVKEQKLRTKSIGTQV
jgi:hypothetical protein